MHNLTQHLLTLTRQGYNPYPALSLAESTELLTLTLISPWKRTADQQTTFERLYRQAFKTGV